LIGENAPRVKQPNPPPVAADERNAQAAFQRSNRALDGRNAQIEGLGGSAQMLEFREGQENLEIVKAYLFAHRRKIRYAGRNYR
jgi:hypothetical protein